MSCFDDCRWESRWLHCDKGLDMIIYLVKLLIIGSDKGFLFVWVQAIIDTSARMTLQNNGQWNYFPICKWLFYYENFTEVCSYESNWQYPSIGSNNGWAPNRRQAIIWTNADPIHWCIYAALGGDKFNSLIYYLPHMPVGINLQSGGSRQN